LPGTGYPKKESDCPHTAPRKGPVFNGFGKNRVAVTICTGCGKLFETPAPK